MLVVQPAPVSHDRPAIRDGDDLTEGVYVVANAQFYLMISLVLFIVYGVVFLTRYLDYWEILPTRSSTTTAL